jgi:copper chaperone CopZ
MTIKNELGDLAGVQKVEANRDTRIVTVEWTDPANWEQIKGLLEEINYPPAPNTN